MSMKKCGFVFLSAALAALTFAGNASAGVLLSDTFDGPSLDTTKWTQLAQGKQDFGGITTVTVDGYLTLSTTFSKSTPSGFWPGVMLQSNQTFVAGSDTITASIERVNLTQSADNNSQTRFYAYYDRTHYVAITAGQADGNGGIGLFYCDGNNEWGTNMPLGKPTVTVDKTLASYRNSDIILSLGVTGTTVTATMAAATAPNTVLYTNSYTLSGVTADTPFQVMFSSDLRTPGQTVTSTWDNLTVTAPGTVPEPSTAVLILGGFAGLLAYAWRRRKIGG